MIYWSKRKSIKCFSVLFDTLKLQISFKLMETFFSFSFPFFLFIFFQCCILLIIISKLLRKVSHLSHSLTYLLTSFLYRLWLYCIVGKIIYNYYEKREILSFLTVLFLLFFLLHFPLSTFLISLQFVSTKFNYLPHHHPPPLIHYTVTHQQLLNAFSLQVIIAHFIKSCTFLYFFFILCPVGFQFITTTKRVEIYCRKLLNFSWQFSTEFLFFLILSFSLSLTLSFIPLSFSHCRHFHTQHSTTIKAFPNVKENKFNFFYFVSP